MVPMGPGDVVRRHGQEVHLRHIRDATALEQAAHFLEVGRQDVHRFALQQFAEMMPLVMVLARGDRSGG